MGIREDGVALVEEVVVAVAVAVRVVGVEVRAAAEDLEVARAEERVVKGAVLLLSMVRPSAVGEGEVGVMDGLSRPWPVEGLMEVPEPRGLLPLPVVLPESRTVGVEAPSPRARSAGRQRRRREEGLVVRGERMRVDGRDESLVVGVSILQGSLGPPSTSAGGELMSGREAAVAEGRRGRLRRYPFRVEFGKVERREGLEAVGRLGGRWLTVVDDPELSGASAVRERLLRADSVDALVRDVGGGDGVWLAGRPAGAGRWQDSTLGGGTGRTFSFMRRMGRL